MEQTESPTLEESRKLYAAAIAFQKLACWDWMLDSHNFGVQNPESGEIGYCCVMGNLGEHYALAVYLGDEGLQGLKQMRSGRVPDNPAEVLRLQKCLSASFEDREFIQAEDREVMRALGLKFRGRNAWPLFRSYRPGYQPWFLDAAETRFLTLALEQAMEVALRFRENRRLLSAGGRNTYLVRVPEPDGDGWKWHDETRKPGVYRPEIPTPPPVNDILIQRVLNSTQPTDGVLEADYFTLPGAVQENKGTRPFYPYLCLFVDHESGFLFGQEIVPPSEIAESFGNSLLEILERIGMLPDTIQVCRPEALALLEPIAFRLNIRLKSVRRLPAMEEAEEALLDFLSFRL